MEKELHEKLDQLLEAKKNVLWLLEHPTGLVDMHDIAYWASVVETKRQEFKERL